MIDRRTFLRSTLAGAAATVAGATVVRSQQGQGAKVGIGDSSNLFAMDQAAARTVRRPAKPGAVPSMDDAKRDELERTMRCQCGCTLDIYTCRTTDFSCRVSPAMHGDIMALVAGGYSAQEIVDAFVGEYGQSVLMAPPARGFNLLGYGIPYVALGAGAGALLLFLRRGRQPRPKPQSVAVAPPGSTTNATPDELARLDEAIRKRT